MIGVLLCAVILFTLLNNINIMALESKDLELIERVIYKNGDDIAVSIGRSFERLEERIDGAESRIYGRLVEIEDLIEGLKDDVV